MNAALFINTLAAAIGLMASGFFAFGAISMGPRSIAQLTSTYWDANPHWADSIAAQRADYIVGAILLVLSFALQLAANLAPAGIQSFPVAPFGPAIVGMSLFVAMLLVLSVLSRQGICSATKRQVQLLQPQNQSSP